MKPNITVVDDTINTNADQSVYIDRFAKSLYITAIYNSYSIIQSHQFNYIQLTIDSLKSLHFDKNKYNDCNKCSRLTSSTVCCEYICSSPRANSKN